MTRFLHLSGRLILSFVLTLAMNAILRNGGDFGIQTTNFAVIDTPEPVTSVLLGSGLLGFALLARRKRK